MKKYVKIVWIFVSKPLSISTEARLPESQEKK